MRRPSPRRRFSVRRLAALPALALAAATLPAVGASPAASADPAYTVQTLHFKVFVGPAGSQVCDIVGDLYLPPEASSSDRVPAILTTNGFGGSKDGQAGTGKAFAQRGYAVLSYSGLGFGGSDCKITLDDPDWDGVAGRQLVSYLGGASGIAFTDDAHQNPVEPLDVVRLDAPGDPRVGMVGGSYGGQIQFAVASVDPRVDTIVPIITWSDLTYSLGPNNTSQISGQTTGVTTSTPGATKLTWGLGFSLLGMANGVMNAQTDPMRLLGCPNFALFVCPALVTAGTLGYFDDYSAAHLRHASVASYLSRIKIPVLLIQGQSDTLFNLNEGIANYQALKAQGTPVKMIWQSWGHSYGTPAPGEMDLGNPDPTSEYETGRISDWFEHHLKDSPVGTGPRFSYFRDWVTYSGNAAPAYANAPGFPVGSTKSYYLSGGALTTNPLGLATSSQSLLTAPAGVPTNLTALDAISYFAELSVPEYDVPGTTGQWTTAPLASNVDVVGSPVLKLRVVSPTAAVTQLAGPAGKLVLFVRIQDVAPDGTSSDIRNLTAPVRVPDVTKPFTVTMPAFVHRFAPGHRIKLVVAASSLNYRGGDTANLVTVTTGSNSQVLQLPVVG